MNIMIDRQRKLVLLAVIAAGLLPAVAAQAQWYGSSYTQPAPLYPYAVQEEQPYAVELAPNIYAIPYHLRAYPYVHCLDGCGRRAPIAEWRRRGHIDRTVINTTRIVRDPPVVVETQRVVDDPPRVIERRHVIEDRNTGARANRVIQADAEITILGPDRMNIRLFRKGQGPKANAHTE